MKRHIFITLLFMLALIGTGQAQNLLQDEFFELDTCVYGNKIYEARDSIKFTPGFYATSNNNQSFQFRISPYLVFPPEGGETGGPDPEDDGVVGLLPGQHGVSETGGFTYSVPIEVPPGINGLKPNISLNYNSQSGFGLLGYGWNLSGQMAITRTGESYHIDGEKTGVDLDGDKYALGGQRLLVVEGNYGADKSEYRTEIASQQRIIAYRESGFTGDGPQRFKVFGADRKIYYYGWEDNGRLNAQTDESVLQWHLTKVEDRKGNYIEYVYNKNDDIGEIYLKKVKLFNNLDEEIYQVVFHYEDYFTDIINYVQGNALIRSKTLISITVEKDNETFYTYTASHELDTDSTILRLKNIDYQVNNPGNTHLNNTEFGWHNKPEKMLEHITARIPVSFGTEEGVNYYSYSNYSTGDFNGDGKEDYLINYSKDQNFPYKHDTTMCFLGNGNGASLTPVWSDNYKPNGNENSNILYNLVGEINGDGMKDFIRVAKNESNNMVEATVFLNTSTSGNTNFTEGSSISYWYMYEPEFRLADIDGNGMQELVSITGGMGLFIHKSPELDFLGADTLSDTNNKLYIGDFNGDGEQDLFVVDDNGVKIFNIEPEGDSLFNQIYTDGYPTRYHHVEIADFNGDGRADILTWVEQAGWELKLNTGYGPWADGDGKWWHKIICPIQRNQDPDDYNFNDIYYTVDLNRDGKSDIVEMYKEDDNDPEEFYKLNLYLSKGQSFVKKHDTIMESDSSWIYIKNSTNRFVDINGDGQGDILLGGRHHSDWDRGAYLFNVEDKSKLVRKVTNSFNDSICIAYENLNKTDYSYNYALSNNKPDYFTAVSTMHVATEISSYDNSVENKTTYSYDDAIIHLKGRGFMGFGKTSSYNNLSDIYSVTEKELFESDALLLDSSNTSYLGQSQSDKINEQYTTYDILRSELSDKHLLIHPKETIAKNWDVLNGKFLSKKKQQSFISSPYWYKFGRVDSVKTMVSQQDDDTYKFEKVKAFEYSDPDIENWIINLKLKETEVHRKQGEKPVRKTVSMEPYPVGSDDFPNYKFIKTYAGDSLERVKEITYDNWGNVTGEKITATYTDLPSRETTAIYGPEYNHRFLTSETTENGDYDMTTTYTRHPLYGYVLTETDPLGLETTHEYNDFNRKIKTSYPDNAVDKFAKRWVTPEDEHAPESALYFKWQQSSGHGWSKSYYNHEGQLLRSAAQADNGRVIYKDKQYNNKGKPENISDPYYADETPSYTNIIYDELGRKMEVTLPDGSLTEYNYSGHETTVDAPGLNLKKTTVKNAMGWTSSVKDKGDNIVRHSYYSDGKLKSSVVNGKEDTRVEMEYDLAANRTVLKDPSAGTVLTEYNPFGEVIYQKDNKGYETTFEYDRLGRNTEVRNGYHTVKKVYDTKPNGLGQLSSVSSANHQMEYEYDEMGRVEEQVEFITDNEPVRVQYTYDGISRKETMNYGDIIIKNTYDELSNLQRITDIDQNVVLWEAQDRDEHGAITEFTYGNGLTTTQTYYENTHLPKNIFDNTGEVINYEYIWDDEKNMESRHDIIYDRKETFHYDRLNRLNVQEIEEGGHLEKFLLTKYHDNGNIESKDEVGNFDYSLENHPYQLKQINTDSLDTSLFYNHQIDYNELDKTASIIDSTNGNFLTLSYGIDEQRIFQNTVIGATTTEKYYFGNGVERIITTKDNEEPTETLRIYLSAPGGAFAYYEIPPHHDKGTYYYLHKDYQGTVVAVTNRQGDVEEHLRYDPWGLRKDPVTWDTDFSGGLTDRGYTMHEHLDDFGLINMNGRVYDPLLGRFLSPDNYIQSPDNPQNYNRYAYALNNPLKYTDPSGEFFGTVFTGIVDFVVTAFFEGGLDPTSKNARRNAWRDFDPTAEWSQTNKAWKIDMGLFKTDENRNTEGRIFQLFSRFTWELPQTVLGNGYSHLRNISGNVDDISYYGGATLVNKHENADNNGIIHRWGLTLGSYINSKNVVADPYTDDLFRHEYGHTLQSRLVGPLYLTHVGLPSLIGSGLDVLGLSDHRREWYETQANRMSKRYFNNHNPEALAALQWNKNKYPREYNPNWYWAFAHPPLPFMWWLYF